jgi:hypothetical protein
VNSFIQNQNIYLLDLDITSDKQRELLFDMQMKDVEAIARELMSNAGTLREEFTTAKHLEHVRPMFQVEKLINKIINQIFIF